MDPVRGENIDGAGERRRHRGNENREAAVRQFFDDKRRDQGFFNLGERGLPDVFLIILTRQSLRQTPKERVAGHSFEERFLDALLDRVAGGGAYGSTDKETDNQYEEERENMFRG